MNGGIRLVNRTRGAILADRVERAERVLDRMRGLLGRAALGDGEALAIAPCGSIHTFFMKFEIDAVFLDRRGRVVRALPGLRPWRATRFHLRAEQVVELPAGTLERTGTREGDELAFEPPAAV
ncbi:MAG TPA: DUF192 domain-containing protein [Myxococcales bacterium]|nr:DUF192 domain-containing protein [Myxococcales bacterium]